jgi:sulfate adenylyltransferase subunit 1 (EFTu-like GTPase family)
MDLVDFDRQTYDDIVDAFETILPNSRVHAIPMSALNGDNVIAPSDRTPWYDGKSLLAFLETVEVDDQIAAKPFRFPVQLVSRPDLDFRGYAGQILSGSIFKGAPVTVWPSGRTARVRRIVTWDGDLEMAHAPMSVTLVLDDEIDISRGDVLTGGVDAMVGQHFDADIVWMDERPLDPARVYLLKHTTRTVTAEVDRRFMLNQIASANVATSRPLIFDRYGENRATGSFILIDPTTNFTAGAGMIVNVAGERTATAAKPSAAERLARLARAAVTDADAVEAVRRALEDILK